MSIEVVCPACEGSIQIEDVSEVVACPLCEKHLQLDPETNVAVLVPEEAEDEITAETDDHDAISMPEINADTESVPAVSPPPDAATDDSDLTDSETKSASPFAFLPGGNSPDTKKKEPVRPKTNFSFLPGGSNDSEEVKAEEETAATAAEETTPEAEPETVPEEIVAEENPAEENAGLESVHAFSHPKDETTDAFDLTDTESETVSQFGFVPLTISYSKTPAAATEEATAAEESTPEQDIETPTEPVSADVAESVTEGETSETPAEENSTSAETVAEETSTESESPAVPAPQNYRKQKVVPKRLFTLTLTYAVAATILVAMLLYAKYLGDPHQLESLPDLKPPVKNDEIALQLVPENATLPAGHTLKLGEPGRRFGNVLVTPLRVTRGPLEFEHYTGDATRTRAPSADVLKLHLRFENVSDDQTFEPLDQKLLLTRVGGKTSESQMRANNFVSRVDQKQTDGERVLIYDMPPSWEWNLKGQNINQEAQPQNLKPGESFETYVATNEQGIDSLKGDLVWRLQLRKGYNPKSYRGVTTLIEVLFNSDQIQAENASEQKEPLPTT
ncbi:MAG: hypothetical protein ABIK07_06030 [Planctomycetota bacterium]